jgi:hypothetical protein
VVVEDEKEGLGFFLTWTRPRTRSVRAFGGVGWSLLRIHDALTLPKFLDSHAVYSKIGTWYLAIDQHKTRKLMSLSSSAT